MAQVALSLLYLDSLSRQELEKALLQPEFTPYASLYTTWLKEPPLEKVGDEELRESLGEEKTYFLFNPPGEISLDMSQFLNLPRLLTMEILLNSWLLYFLEKGVTEAAKRLLRSPQLKEENASLDYLSLLLRDKFHYRKTSPEERKELFQLAQRRREKLNSL